MTDRPPRTIQGRSSAASDVYKRQPLRHAHPTLRSEEPPIPKVFYQLEQWQKTHPGQAPEDQMLFTQPSARGTSGAQQIETIYYQYRADRARSRQVAGVGLGLSLAPEIALAHLRLPIGARVGVPAWTFVSTALAAVHNNLQPVLIDVEASTLNIAPESLEAAIAEGLDAVIAVHFGGVPVPVVIRQLCEDAGLPLPPEVALFLASSGAFSH